MTKPTLIILLTLNEIRGIIFTAPAWVWLWHHWHALILASGLAFHF